MEWKHTLTDEDFKDFMRINLKEYNPVYTFLWMHSTCKFHLIMQKYNKSQIHVVNGIGQTIAKSNRKMLLLNAGEGINQTNQPRVKS